jgi:hypothetical protein
MDEESKHGDGERVMKKILVLAAAGEAALGLILLVYPSIVVRLLFNAQIAGAGMVMSRVAGIALIALGVACWPGPPRAGMLTYSAVVTLYLAYVGFAGGMTGLLLWPAVVLHVIVTILLVSARPWDNRGAGERRKRI